MKLPPLNFGNLKQTLMQQVQAPTAGQKPMAQQGQANPFQVQGNLMNPLTGGSHAAVGNRLNCCG